MRIGLYARVSSDSSEQENALGQQLDRLRAAASGHETVEYIEVMSGRRDDRPQLAKLMQACRHGELDRVICTRLDRLSRSMAHGAELLIYFSAPDTPSLLALDDNLDLATASGRLMANILISFAVAESDRISERVSHGKQYERKQRKPLGPWAPYGYRFNAAHDNYELDPETAPHARELVDTFLKEPSLRALTRKAATIPSCRLRSTHGLRRWLGNPTLTGARVYGRYKYFRDGEGKRKRKLGQPWEWAQVIPNCHPALISQEEHEQIVRIFRNHTDRQRSALTERYVGKLTGLVRCGNCGSLLYYQHVQNKQYKYFFCHNANCVGVRSTRIRADEVEAAIWQELRRHQEQLLAVALYQHAIGPEVISVEQELQHQIRELEAKQDPDLQQAIAAKRKRLGLLVDQRLRSRCGGEEAEAMRRALQSEEFWQLAQSDPQRCRAFFVEYVERVIVSGDRIERIELRLPSRLPTPSARLPASDP